MTQQLAGGHAPTVEEEVTSQKNVATSPRVKKPRNWQKRRLKKKCSKLKKLKKPKRKERGRK